MKKSKFTNDKGTPGGAVFDTSASLASLTSDVFAGDGDPIIVGPLHDGGNNKGLAYPPPSPPVVPSCTSRPNGVVTLPSPKGPFVAYCYGGYVLLAKIDGRTQTWAYTSSLWTDGTTLNAGNLSMAQAEGKFPAFNQLGISTLRVRAGGRWLGVASPTHSTDTVLTSASPPLARLAWPTSAAAPPSTG